MDILKYMKHLKFLKYLTGGRPMMQEDSVFSFRDVVSGEMVHHFTDKFGRRWMAEHEWSWFRVEMRG